MHDWIIKNGLIIDGTGAPPFRGDVVVQGDEIAAVDRNLAVSSSFQILDASGLIVSPGFIDTHSHSDFSLILSPDAQSALFQGVTTEVIGNCGLSAFPISSKTKEQLQAYVRGIRYESSLDIDWADLQSYAAAVEGIGIGINIAPLVGHGSIRIAVMGFEARNAQGSELAAMTFLASLLPPWVFEGGIEKTLWRLSEQNERARVVKAVETSFAHLDPDIF